MAGRPQHIEINYSDVSTLVDLGFSWAYVAQHLNISTENLTEMETRK